jgi:ADP-ribose pyrophosphatase YjhB (NUDIX family)
LESAATREVREEYSAEVLDIETIGVRNVLRGDPVSRWVALVFAVKVDPAAVAIGEPVNFDELAGSRRTRCGSRCTPRPAKR